MSVASAGIGARLWRDERALLRWIVRNGLAVWVIDIAVVVWLTVARPTEFLTSADVSNVLSNTVIYGLVGVGETFVILSAGIDLSVGSMATLTTVLCAGLDNGHAALVAPVVVLMCLVGSAYGVVQGMLVARARLDPFVVTLAGYFILAGVAYSYAPTTIGAIPAGLSNAAFAAVGPIPWLFVVVLAIGVLLNLVLSRLRVGRHIYAVGGNAAMARASGINVVRTTTLCYVVSGVLAALAGCMLAVRAGVGTPNAGSGLELLAITVAVVGGTSLVGGRGRLLGTAGGVLLLALIQQSFLLLNISSYYQSLVTGAVIVAAVALFVRRD